MRTIYQAEHNGKVVDYARHSYMAGVYQQDKPIIRVISQVHSQKNTQFTGSSSETVILRPVSLPSPEAQIIRNWSVEDFPIYHYSPTFNRLKKQLDAIDEDCEQHAGGFEKAPIDAKEIEDDLALIERSVASYNQQNEKNRVDINHTDLCKNLYEPLYFPTPGLSNTNANQDKTFVDYWNESASDETSSESSGIGSGENSPSALSPNKEKSQQSIATVCSPALLADTKIKLRTVANLKMQYEMREERQREQEFQQMHRDFAEQQNYATQHARQVARFVVTPHPSATSQTQTRPSPQLASRAPRTQAKLPAASDVQNGDSFNKQKYHDKYIQPPTTDLIINQRPIAGKKKLTWLNWVKQHAKEIESSQYRQIKEPKPDARPTKSILKNKNAAPLRKENFPLSPELASMLSHYHDEIPPQPQENATKPAVSLSQQHLQKNRWEIIFEEDDATPQSLGTHRG